MLRLKGGALFPYSCQICWLAGGRVGCRAQPGRTQCSEGVLTLNTHVQSSPGVPEAVNLSESPRTRFSKSWEAGRLESLRQCYVRLDFGLLSDLHPLGSCVRLTLHRTESGFHPLVSFSFSV